MKKNKLYIKIKVLMILLIFMFMNTERVRAENDINRAQAGEGEFVPDPEMEDAIRKKEQDMREYWLNKNVDGRSSEFNCLTNIIQHPQETGSWCAYASMQSILEGQGVAISQSQIVNEISGVTGFTYDFSGEGCPWLMVHGNEISEFPAAVYLNSKLGEFEYAPYPYGPAGGTAITTTQIKARVVYSIDNGKGVLVNGDSKPNDLGYIDKYPLYNVGHWIVARGYSYSGDRILMVDPAHSTQVSWGSNIQPYYVLDLANLTGFARTKGIMY